MNFWRERFKSKEQVIKDIARKAELESLKTRTTRYMAEDGRERAVLLWDDYELLLRMASSMD